MPKTSPSIPAGLRPSTRVATGTAYRLPVTDIVPDLRLDRNEGRPSRNLTAALARIDTECLRRYPQVSELELTLARQLDVKPDQVLATAGGDDALLRICMAFLEPGREILLAVPTFEMISKYARLAGGKIKEVPWPAEQFPTGQVIESLSPVTGIVAVVSPNNPTGAIASLDDLKKLAEAAKTALLLVDLAYTEFADVDMTQHALQNPNAIVVRTFSKAWGLAGIRCGYAVGPAALIELLRRAGNPYPVSGPSIAMALAALSSENDEQASFLTQVRCERKELHALLVQRGWDVVPSQANFVFARTPRAEWIWRGLLNEGIAVRWFGEQSDLNDALRITCPGNALEFDRLRKALAKVI